MPATPFLFSLRQDRCEPEDDFRCGGERWNRRPNVVAAEKDGTGGQISLRRGQAATPAAFYLGLCRLRGNLSLPAPATVILQAGHSSLRQRQSCRRAVQYCDNGLPQAELLFFETTKIRIGRAPLRHILLQASYSSLRQRKLESDAASLRLRLLQAGHSILRQRASAGGLFYLPRRLLQAELQYFATKKIGIGRGTVAATPAQAGHSTCRHDGTAVIPDFRPRLGNRCSYEVHSGHFRAAIPDFRPRLANRCSKEV